jgi:hypothetical protein
VRSTAFTFGTLLAFYLLGSGLGCLAGIPLAKRLRRPLCAFLLCQCLLLAYAGLAALALVSLPAGLPLYEWFVRYWDGPREFALGSDWDASFLFRLYVLLPSALFGPATLLMGLSFPALQRAVHDDAITSGRKVGQLQAANIAGCVSGSLGVGLPSGDALGHGVRDPRASTAADEAPRPARGDPHGALVPGGPPAADSDRGWPQRAQAG